MRSMSTFTGMGGNDLAFASFVYPTLYCEIDPDTIKLLKSVIQRGVLPDAPIHKDIQTLVKSDIYIQLKGTIDLLSASWPCQGNSSMGKRKGMEDARSGLIRDTCAVILDLNPPVVFLENVAPARNNGSLNYIVDTVGDRYIISFGCFTAYELGFEHERERFFCVLLRNDDTARDKLRKMLAAARPPAAVGAEPIRMTNQPGPYSKLRYHALGNAVVPLCSYHAFTTLGPHTLAPMTGSTTFPADPKALPKSGVVWGGVIRELTHPAVAVTRRRTALLTIDPSKFTPPVGTRRGATLIEENILTEPVKRLNWSTPRAGCHGACNFLTSGAQTTASGAPLAATAGGI